MKKLIALASLSVAGLIFNVSQASAWWCCHKHCNSCCTTICIQPYNAFTPICCGNLACNGCCPINLTQGCCGQGNCGYGGGMACGAYGCAADSYGGYGAGCAAGAYGVGQLPILDATQQRTLAATPPVAAPPSAPTFQSPAPAPKTGPTSYIPGLQSSELPMLSTIQTASYQQSAGSVLGPVPNAFSSK